MGKYAMAKPKATAQISTPLPAQDIDLWGLLRSRVAKPGAFLGDHLRMSTPARGISTTTFDSAALVGRFFICRFAKELALLGSSYDRAPAMSFSGFGDGLLMLQLRLEGDAMYGLDAEASASRAALTWFPHGARLSWTLPHAGAWRTLVIIGSPAVMESRWGLGKAMIKAMHLKNQETRPASQAVHRPWTVTRESLEVLRAILGCRMEGALLRSYYEARSQQLLCEFLSAGPLQPRELPRHVRLAERLRHAREALIADPARPHTLQSLAREHGLSRRLLAEGFRTQFGETMFECLQRERLQRAWALLARSQGKVSSVATQVGYRDAASFARAFKSHFGVTPSQAVKASFGPAEGVRP
jgi:AraC-like DNA-binding protein